MSRKEKRQEKDKKNKKIIKWIIIAMLFLVIIIALSYIGITMYLEYKEKNRYEELAEYMEQEATDDTEVITERMLKLQELHEQNEDIVAWIEIPNTNINYPILQTDNNSYYLKHDYNKEYSSTGSIFLDKDVDLELPSSNFLMYGHRNTKGAMFEDLINYKDKEFYNKHKIIRITTLKEDTEYEIMAVFYSRVYYKSETNVFRYYYFINAETEEEYNKYVQNAKRVSIYDTGVNAKYGDQLITLSTCEYSQDNGRFAVVAKKIDE